MIHLGTKTCAWFTLIWMNKCIKWYQWACEKWTNMCQCFQFTNVLPVVHLWWAFLVTNVLPVRRPFQVTTVLPIRRPFPLTNVSPAGSPFKAFQFVCALTQRNDLGTSHQCSRCELKSWTRWLPLWPVLVRSPSNLSGSAPIILLVKHCFTK